MDKDFRVCASSELDIFTRPPYQTSILSSRWVEYTPTLNFDKGNTPIHIEVTGTKGEYIDLSNTFFYMRASIINNSTKNLITDSDDVGPINYLQNSIFKQVDVLLNKKLVSMPCDYGYRCVLESLLNYGEDSKSSHLEASLWSKDEAGKMDAIVFQNSTNSSISKMESRKKRDLPVDGNSGLIARRSFFLDKSCEMYGRIHADIFNIEKLLVDDVNMELKLFKNRDEFCLMGKTGYSLQIDEFVLNVRKVKISDQVLIAHAMALERGNAIYPLSRVDVQGRTINHGVISERFENIIKGPLPKRIV